MNTRKQPFDYRKALQQRDKCRKKVRIPDKVQFIFFIGPFPAPKNDFVIWLVFLSSKYDFSFNF